MWCYVTKRLELKLDSTGIGKDQNDEVLCNTDKKYSQREDWFRTKKTWYYVIERQGLKLEINKRNSTDIW